MTSVFRKLHKELLRLRSATRRYELSLPFASGRFWHLYRYEQFSPDEIFLLGLLDKRLTEKQLREFVSKEHMLQLQCRVNPASHSYLTENKISFHVHCEHADLPTPRVYAAYVASRQTGASSVGAAWPSLGNLEEWRRFHQENTIERVILKPADGVHGRGVLRLDRVRSGPSGYKDEDNRFYSDEALLAHMQDTEHGQWLLEECLEAHPSLTRLSGTAALQTTRVVTFVDRRGTATILAAVLRIITGANIIDNFNFGASGNLIAHVNPRNGAIEEVLGANADGHGMASLRAHPDTGQTFLDVHVPDWAAVSALTKRAALSFEPLKTIGWDVGITPRGPVLIEGNVTWDPLHGNPRMRSIYQTLWSDFSKRNE